MNLYRTVTALGAGLVLVPALVFAGHKTYVGQTIIDSADRGIYQEHGVNCAYRHYHGELNGVADPAPDGCGHGEVKSIVHGDGDGETIPPPPAKGNWERFTTWVSDWWNNGGKEDAKNVVDVAAESNGVPPPFQTAEVVDIVVDAAPSIKENADNAKEYFETYEDAPDRDRYTLEGENPEANAPSPGLYRWFWSFFE